MSVTALGAERESGIVIPSATAEKLIGLEDGDAIRLYLLLCSGAVPEEDALCRRLGLTAERLARAEERLVAAGLARSAPREAAGPALREGERVPVYSVEEIAELKTRDPAFAQIVCEAERVIKPLLTQSDLRELMTLYSYFGLSAEAFIALIHFVAARASRQSDGARRPSMMTLRKEAMRWVDMGITDGEKAEEYSVRELELAARAREFEKLLKLSACTNEDRWLLRSWAELGFDGDAVRLAAEISVKRKGEILLTYMNRIIRGWKQDGLTDSAEIARRERAAEQKLAEARTAAARRGGRKTAPGAKRELSPQEKAAIAELIGDA